MDCVPYLVGFLGYQCGFAALNLEMLVLINISNIRFKFLKQCFEYSTNQLKYTNDNIYINKSCYKSRPCFFLVYTLTYLPLFNFDLYFLITNKKKKSTHTIKANMRIKFLIFVLTESNQTLSSEI